MNKVFLIGNLTRDPELNETSSGVTICRFTIAVNRPYINADGERKADFFNIVAWRGLGESVAKYAKKGNKVAVTGSLETRNYEDSEGTKRIAIDVIAQEVEFLTPREEGKRSDASTTAQGGTASGRLKSSKAQLSILDDDSDIPF